MKWLNALIGDGLSAIGLDITIFCSCSSIPIFIGFTNAGLSLGVTFSFLSSSPLVDSGALVLLMSIFGAKIEVTYVIVGLVLAVIFVGIVAVAVGIVGIGYFFNAFSFLIA